MNSPRTVIALAALVWGGGFPAAAEEPPDMAAFLQTYCISCHGPDEAKDDIRLDGLSFPIRSDEDAELWHRVLESLQFGEMPSDRAKKFPTRAESREIENFIASALADHGREMVDASRQEGLGNLVPHELLFSPEERQRPVDVGARLWRVSPEVLDETARAARLRVTSNPFMLEPPNGKFRDYKGKYVMSSVATEQLVDLAMQVAATQLPKLQERIDAAMDRDQAIREALTGQFNLALRRSPSDEDLAELEEVMRKVDKDLGAPSGLQAAIAYMILLPEHIFRYETVGSEVSDTERGLIRLTSGELADALAFALTGRNAPTALRRDFLADTRPVAEVLETFATRLLGDGANPQVLRFFREYLDYEKCSEVFKDPVTQHRHAAESLERDLDRLIEHVLRSDKQVLRSLLTTREFLISANVAPTWNLPPGWKMTNELVALPPDQRMGILTHPAWLVAHSGNFDNDPIHRGLWIQRKLLGGNVPAVPITVDARLPEEPTWTLRKRLQVTEADQCYKCHSKMNPLGLPFERYDHFGRYRIDELLAPVQTSGAIPHTGVPGLHGEVATPFELIEKLAKSEHVEQVFVRHVFRFFMGRNETLGDAKTLQDAHRAYVEADGSMKALVTSLLTSDSFIYRKNAEE